MGVLSIGKKRGFLCERPLPPAIVRIRTVVVH